MGMVLPFFPRQTLTGGTAWVTYLSDPFDVSDYDSLNLEVQVFGLIGTFPSVLVALETADNLYTDPSNWVPRTAMATITSAPYMSNDTVPPGATQAGMLGRFVRAKVEINPSDKAVTIAVIGIARQRS